MGGQSLAIVMRILFMPSDEGVPGLKDLQHWMYAMRLNHTDVLQVENCGVCMIIGDWPVITFNNGAGFAGSVQLEIRS
jgi:hypothetical protein